MLGFANSKFRATGPNSRECPGQFAVDRAGRHLVIYSEPEALLHLEVEAGTPLAVYLSAVTSWKVPPGTPLTADDRRRIAANVSEGLMFLRIPNEIL